MPGDSDECVNDRSCISRIIFGAGEGTANSRRAQPSSRDNRWISLVSVEFIISLHFALDNIDDTPTLSIHADVYGHTRNVHVVRGYERFLKRLARTKRSSVPSIRQPSAALCEIPRLGLPHAAGYLGLADEWTTRRKRIRWTVLSSYPRARYSSKTNGYRRPPTPPPPSARRIIPRLPSFYATARANDTLRDSAHSLLYQ